jgi:hypothetical protein
MNALTLACLLGTVSSMKMMVDLSDEGSGGNGTAHNTTEEAWTDPCPSGCGPDPCMDLVSPCDELAPEWNENDPDAEQDWTAYENCWETNEDADPWTACYATNSEYDTCMEAE